MSHILRWPAVLALLALVLASLGAAAAAGIVLGGAPIDLSTALTEEQLADIARVSWLEVGLWVGAGLFFLIAAIRLIRRTQGFWMWLLGFACYGGRWAMAQQQDGGNVLATVQSVDVSAYAQPAQLAQNSASTESQLAILAIIIIVGVIAAIVDAADRSYWNKQGA